MTESVNTRLKLHAKTDVSLIPGGLTKQLQPADISWLESDVRHQTSESSTTTGCS